MFCELRDNQTDKRLHSVTYLFLHALLNSSSGQCKSKAREVEGLAKPIASVVSLSQ